MFPLFKENLQFCTKINVLKITICDKEKEIVEKLMLKNHEKKLEQFFF